MKLLTQSALAAVLLALPATAVFAQQRGGPNLDHQEMMAKLGIKELRPGAAGQDVTSPLYANYDENLAIAKSAPPPLLVNKAGQKITTPAMWEANKKDLFEVFDREFFGRLPDAAKTIKVTWEVTATTQGMSGNIPTITRTLVGHVDPTYYPAIKVDIGASITTPANAAGKVPVIIVFGGGGGGGAGRGGRGPAATLPTIQQLQTALTLTDAQVTTIRPLLEKAQADLTAAQPATPPAAAPGAPAPATPPAAPVAAAPAAPAPDAGAAIRTALTEKINAVLTDTQKPLLAAAFAPPAAGRAGGAPRAGGPGGAAVAGGPGGAGRAGGPPAPTPSTPPPFPNGAATWQQAAISLGYGYGSLNPGSIQADSGGDNLKLGIIGLINKGQSRKVDDWGALRAWAWGAGKLIDFFETDSMVDAKQVAFEGHSRYGKATLATLVYEPRVLTGFVSSSGQGGAKMWRRTVGEKIENLAGPSEYHWMAGNFLKYAGPLTVDDMPVDAHQFVALVAPRPIFVSGGEYVEGNGKPGTNSRYSGESWQDTPGTFMATAGASPVWALLGKKPLSNGNPNLTYAEPNNPLQLKVPPPLTTMIEGDIAFRQHDAGHTDGPNWSTFIAFTQKHFKSPGFKK